MKTLLLLLISLSLFAQKPLTGTQIWNKAKVEINSISTNDLKKLLNKDKNVVLIDVRTKFEIANAFEVWAKEQQLSFWEYKI
jgi:predicted sulfurtransferase